MSDAEFDRNVFLNCPFDKKYEPIFQAVLFCLVQFGLTPRFATERSDASEARINKIRDLICSARYSIHDLSRCQARKVGEYYRLNMPFELGMDFGCRHYGGHPFSTKVILVLEKQRFRYQAAISDLAGIDIEAHRGKYSPQTGLLYVNAIDRPFGSTREPRGVVSAYDPTTGELAWRQVFEGYGQSGPVVTAGGLVFVGAGSNIAGYFYAYDALTGEELWRFNTGSGIYAAPSVYMVDGEQFVTVASGGGDRGRRGGDLILSFALPPR